MIISNFAVLLAERKLSITKVSKDTKISRTTLTALANNRFQGIHIDTLNVLCLYLNIEPSDLLAFVPYDFEIMNITGNLADENDENCEYIVKFDLEIKSQISIFRVGLSLEIINEKKDNWYISDKEDCSYGFLYYSDNTENNTKLQHLFKKIPVSFKTEITEKIKETINKLIKERDSSLDDLEYNDLYGLVGINIEGLE